MAFDFFAGCRWGVFGFAVATWVITIYHYSAGKRKISKYGTEHGFSEACRPTFEKAWRNCMSEIHHNATGSPQDAEEVFLVYWITRHKAGSRASFLSRWSWDSHWALETRGEYFELRRARDVPTRTGFKHYRSTVPPPEENDGQRKILLRSTIGASHFSNDYLGILGMFDACGPYVAY
jgi:hypothetical protein